MYAIVEIGGKQFRVSKDMKLRVPLLKTEAGKKVGFDQVLLVDDGNGKTTIGNPIIKNMLVNATVIEHNRDKKIIVFKKKRRKGYQKKQGHRQGFSVIEINTIGSGSLKRETPPEKAETETGKVSAAAPKTGAAKRSKPAVEKKAETKSTVKKTTTKPKSATTAKKTKPASESAASKKTTAKKETKPAAKKKAAAKEDKKED